MTGSAGRRAARSAARAFLDGIVDGDHVAVWAMLHPEARERAVSVALTKGLDRVKAQRFLHGNADPAELDAYQREVVGGLRRDFRSVDLERLGVGPAVPREAADPTARAEVTVDLSSPSTIPGTEAWYAGRLTLCRADDGWFVLDVTPTVAGP